MTDVSDDELRDALRAVLADLRAAAPTAAPAFEQRPARERWTLAVAAAALLVVALIGAAIVRKDSGEQAPQAPSPPPTTAVPRPPAPSGDLARYPSVVATVVSRDVTAGQLSIDAGSDEAIVVGMAVVVGNDLVGDVVSVADDSAVVRLLTSPSYSIECLVNDAPAQCRGAGAGRPLELRDWPLSAVYSGPVAVTRGGATSTAPPGIRIGTLEAGPTGAPAIAPASRLETVAQVAVIRYVPPAAAPTATDVVAGSEDR